MWKSEFWQIWGKCMWHYQCLPQETQCDRLEIWGLHDNLIQIYNGMYIDTITYVNRATFLEKFKEMWTGIWLFFTLCFCMFYTSCFCMTLSRQVICIGRKTIVINIKMYCCILHLQCSILHLSFKFRLWHAHDMRERKPSGLVHGHFGVKLEYNYW